MSEERYGRPVRLCGGPSNGEVHYLRGGEGWIFMNLLVPEPGRHLGDGFGRPRLDVAVYAPDPEGPIAHHLGVKQ